MAVTIRSIGLPALLVVCSTASVTVAGRPATVAFRIDGPRVAITIGGRPFAVYVFSDPAIRRPYFTAVKAPTGQQVTRHHPPRPGVDSTDHATMHPGIQLAFGDLGGADFWRNKASVIHEEFVEKPRGGPATGRFTVRQRYVAGKRTVCREVCRHTVLVRPYGILLTYDSQFWSDESDFAFGDQEEMGLSVRVDRELRVRGGRGVITSSEGRRNEKAVWGRQALWCAYGGIRGKNHVGAILMPFPGNFRACWFHARDYGFLAANPFGRRAFTRGKASRVVVKRGRKFRLRYGVLIHGSPADKPVEPGVAYADYLDVIGNK